MARFPWDDKAFGLAYIDIFAYDIGSIISLAEARIPAMSTRSLFLSLLLCLLLLPLDSSLAAPGKNLSVGEAREMLQKNPQLFLLDVRTPEEYSRGRIEGGRLIPIDQLAARQGEIPQDRPILVYCAVGSRSSQAADYLAARRKQPVYNLFGGIWAWQLRGVPVLQGPP